MKKSIVIIFCTIFVLLSGCTGYNKTTDDRSIQEARMSVVYHDGYVVIYRDNITGVQYFSRLHCGSCVMVDTDGNPLVLKKEVEEQT